MRKLLLLLPLMATGLFMTGCDEVYAERTVVYNDGPGYYGDDFYYVSSRPYSRAYGPLYLRGGRYYYSRGGTYVVYDRGRHHQQHRSHRDHDRRGSDRRGDWDRGRDRDRNRAPQRVSSERRESERRVERRVEQSRRVEQPRRVESRRDEPRRVNVVNVRNNDDRRRGQVQQAVVRRNGDGDRARSDRGPRGDRGSRQDRGEHRERGGRDRDRA